MLAKILSAAVLGIDGFPVQVEVDLSAGLPTFSIVGLPDAAVREAKDRVAAGVRNAGYDLPLRKITVNLSPADVKKEGTAFDLPIAVGVLVASEAVPEERLGSYALVGELALDGRVRPARGILPVALCCRDAGLKGLIFPEANAAEASVVEGLDLVAVSTLREAAVFLATGERPALPAPAEGKVLPGPQPAGGGADLTEVKGQAHAKRALEIAAAGGHNVLFVGPPGSGKTMLARRLPGLLPPLSFEESLQVTKIHSVASALPRGAALMSERPFRAPHHTISSVALVGGGASLRPGEACLAHLGVLFLDELPEFHREALEALRQPLEDGSAAIARATGSVVFPARFALAAAMNPCPCGYLGHPERNCVCTPLQVRRYRARVSGPLMDRIDLHVEVPALKLSELTEEGPAGEASAAVRQRVLAARDRQGMRFKGTDGLFTNAGMSPRHLKAYAKLGDSGRWLLREAVARLGFSARAYDRILKVARTIADLEGVESLRDEHLAEAVGFRSLDRAPVGVCGPMDLVRLNLGCGAFKKEGYVNVDANPRVSPDVLHDLNVFPYPFPTGRFDEIEADHVLEHLHDPFAAMHELHRLLKPGGALRIRVPHFSRGMTHSDHKRSFDLTFPFYFNPTFQGGYAGVEFESLRTSLRWFAQPYLKKTVLPLPLYWAARAFGAVIDMAANFWPFFCSRFWCFWVGGFEEVSFDFRRR